MAFHGKTPPKLRRHSHSTCPVPTALSSTESNLSLMWRRLQLNQWHPPLAAISSSSSSPNFAPKHAVSLLVVRSLINWHSCFRTFACAREHHQPCGSSSTGLTFPPVREHDSGNPRGQATLCCFRLQELPTPQPVGGTLPAPTGTSGRGSRFLSRPLPAVSQNVLKGKSHTPPPTHFLHRTEKSLKK